MQIKTALAIGSGIAIGTIFGMGVSEDTKCRILGKIRKTLIHALGGEEKKTYTAYRNVYRNPTYHTTYASYYSRKEKTKRVDIPDPDLLKFDSYDEAEKCVGAIENGIKNFKYFTVIDLAHYRSKSLDYVWDIYGWEMEDLEGKLPISQIDGKYVLNIPRPKLIKI